MQRVSTIDKGLDVLEAILSAGEGGLGIRALARELDINPTTVHNICWTLSARGYLKQEPASKRFCLGSALLPLARGGELWRDLAETADPMVRQCKEELDESILLAVIDRTEILTLVYYPSSQALRVEEPRVLGSRAYGTAVGKLLLATLSEKDLQRYFKRFPPTAFTHVSVVDLDTLRQELQAVRSQGLARTRDELTPGVSAVAVPIQDLCGETVAALGASAPTVRLDESQAHLACTTLKRYGNDIAKAWFPNDKSGK